MFERRSPACVSEVVGLASIEKSMRQVEKLEEESTAREKGSGKRRWKRMRSKEGSRGKSTGVSSHSSEKHAR